MSKTNPYSSGNALRRHKQDTQVTSRGIGVICGAFLDPRNPMHIPFNAALDRYLSSFVFDALESISVQHLSMPAHVYPYLSFIYSNNTNSDRLSSPPPTSACKPLLSAPHNPRLVSRQRLQLITRVKPGLRRTRGLVLLLLLLVVLDILVGGLRSLLLLLFLLAETGFFECDDVFVCDCYCGGLAAEHGCGLDRVG